ncbi:MAG: extracellular solute-binding protein [bacterium]|nr:extracellular solute-binding protein [bacterium]
MVAARKFWLVLVTAALLLLSTVPAAAQDIVIQIALPGFFEDLIDEELLAEFQAENPGVQVQVVETNTFSVPTGASDLEGHLNAVRDYVSTADVLLVSASGNFISPEATSAGYFLNLGPIANLDPQLNSADFYPATWQAFQWDQAVWGLPVSASVLLLTYDPVAFDNAGLSYPTPQWTVAEFDTAIRALAQRDANGAITTPGMSLPDNYATATFFRSVLTQGLYDTSTLPNAPRFARPDLETLADFWLDLQQEGLVVQGEADTPLAIGSAFDLVQITTDRQPDEAVLLPGGFGGLDVQGFAVSAGTLYPEQAYALARFLTTRQDVAETFGEVAARQSIAQQDTDGGFGFNLPEDAAALLQQGINVGLSPSELRYFDYMPNVFQRMTTEQLDARSALQLVEQDAVAAQQTALDRATTETIAVATPVPVAALGAGEIALNFGYGAFVSPLSNQDKWDALIADFVAADPQIGQVNFDVGFGAFDLNQASEQYDCFYLPFNAVPGADVSRLLSLDPFMDADPTFSRADLVGNTLAQVQSDGRTYAMPITVEPDILRYDSQQFNQVAARLPFAGWTVDDFVSAVRSIRLNPDDPPTFAGTGTGGNDLLILIAAFGAIPFDYRAEPPVYNFTDPAVVDAIRQVLDLAKDGYIRYDRRLGDVLNAFNFGPQDTPTNAIYSDTLSVLNFSAFGGEEEEATDTAAEYLPVTYPQGAQYSAGSYTIGTAYISATTQNAEACYRFISRIATTPDVFTAMPARRSLINDPGTVATQGQDLVNLYNEVDRILADPSTVILPSLFDAASAPQGFLAQLWLFQAFDTYVLDDGDLEAALRDAQNYAVTFQQCIDVLPPLDNSSTESQEAYFDGFLQCAGQVDPRLEPILSLIGG